MATFGFHPEALREYTDAAFFYANRASPKVAEAFVAAVEAAVQAIVAAPDRWRVVDEPSVRRYVFKRFPYVVYYRWETDHDRVTVCAVMHCSRKPGYWKQRLN